MNLSQQSLDLSPIERPMYSSSTPGLRQPIVSMSRSSIALLIVIPVVPARVPNVFTKAGKLLSLSPIFRSSVIARTPIGSVKKGTPIRINFSSVPSKMRTIRETAPIGSRIRHKNLICSCSFDLRLRACTFFSAGADLYIMYRATPHMVRVNNIIMDAIVSIFAIL